jgi:hypothetical protein
METGCVLFEAKTARLNMIQTCLVLQSKAKESVGLLVRHLKTLHHTQCFCRVLFVFYAVIQGRISR